MAGGLYRAAERLMAMDDATWARHANPLSGLTRFTCLPLLALAWIWWNPRAFPPPATTDHWMSRAVQGERIFLTRRDAIPAHHIRAANRLAAASLPGALILIWGLATLWWEGAVFGTLLTMLPKIWFCDRMVWILADMERSP